MHSLNLRYFTVYSFIVMASIVLSIWSGINGSIINNDGVCYLQSAEMLSQGLNAGMHACAQAKWPLYSILIAGLAYFTSLSYFMAACVLDTGFSIMTAVLFVKIVSWISQSVAVHVDRNSLPEKSRHETLLWLAAIVVLLSNEFNSVRYLIIRDHGFWAFYMLSMFFLLRYFQHYRWFDVIAWCVSLVIATLFRVEGAVFLLLLPFLSLLNTRLTFASRIVAFCKMNALLIVLGAGLILWVFVASPKNLGRLNELYLQLTYGFSQLVIDYKIRADHLSEYVLSPFAASYSTWILFITLIVWYVISAIKNVSLIYGILAIFAWSKKIVKASHATRLVLWGYVAINVLVTAVFLAEHMFLSKRYLIALSLVLMIWVPFALQYLYLRWSYQKWPMVLASLLIVATSLGGIFAFGHSKKYIYDAGIWLAKNTPNDATLYSNEILVLYYANRKDIYKNNTSYKDIKGLKNINWQEYQYFALRLDKNNVAKAVPYLQETHAQPIKIFANKRGDQVRVYKSNKA